MTAFARTEWNQDNIKVIWEIRTVNHRYLDAHPRLPEAARQWEPEVRAGIQAQLKRGRVDASAVIEVEQEGRAQPNPALIKQTQVTSQILQETFADAQPLSIYELMQLPGLLRTESIDEKNLQQAVLTGLSENLAALVLVREREGARLKTMLVERLLAVREIVASLRAEMPGLAAHLKQRWQAKLAELSSTELGQDGLDPVRLNQEMAILMTKSDVAEELDRLEAHFDELDNILDKGGAVGRRLDFMMQELNREANTLGSKSYNQVMTAASVELKVLIDQMREQIQNIE